MPIQLDSTGPPRDRWGRYLIPHPETGKPTGFTRATTIAKTLEDPTNLTAWAKRMAAIGTAQKPSIAAGILASLDDRKRLNELVEQAIEAAGGTERRELGTALHRIIELVDLGETTAADNVMFANEIGAYLAARQQWELTPVHTEVILLNFPLGIAGTADRIYLDRSGQLVIGDLKTGGYLSWLSFAMQMAIYATSTHMFDPVAGTVTEAPQIRQDHALIVHLPAGENLCDIYPVSVPIGYDAVLMALEVRRIRKTDRADHVRINPNQPAELTPAVTPTEPAPARNVKHTFSARPAVPVDKEGGPITAAAQQQLRDQISQLNPHAYNILEKFAKEANAKKRSISLNTHPTVRRSNIYRALIRIGRAWPTDLTEQHVRDILDNIRHGIADTPDVTVGETLGSLTLNESQQFVAATIKTIQKQQRP